MGNTDKIDKYLETHNLRRVNHDEIGILNRHITNKVDESIIKILPAKKIPEPLGFPGEFYLTFEGKLILSSSKSTKNFSMKEDFLTYFKSFYILPLSLLLTWGKADFIIRMNETACSYNSCFSLCPVLVCSQPDARIV